VPEDHAGYHSVVFRFNRVESREETRQKEPRRDVTEFGLFATLAFPPSCRLPLSRRGLPYPEMTSSLATLLRRVGTACSSRPELANSFSDLQQAISNVATPVSLYLPLYSLCSLILTSSSPIAHQTLLIPFNPHFPLPLLLRGHPPPHHPASHRGSPPPRRSHHSFSRGAQHALPRGGRRGEVRQGRGSARRCVGGLARVGTQRRQGESTPGRDREETHADQTGVLGSHRSSGEALDRSGCVRVDWQAGVLLLISDALSSRQGSRRDVLLLSSHQAPPIQQASSRAPTAGKLTLAARGPLRPLRSHSPLSRSFADI
jgi:hypothetical protein